MTLLCNYFWVACGGALGTVARFALSGFVAERFPSFPLGTLIINVSGSFVIGLFAALTEPQGPWLVSPTLRAFFMIGVCGGYTTFSSFSLQTLNLAREGQWLYAGLNCLLSFVLCLVAVWLGYIAGLGFNTSK